MARTPERPDLGARKSFLAHLVANVLRIAGVFWLVLQTIGIFFYMAWHYTNHSFREFMFRTYIDYWEKWGGYITTDLTPGWLQWIWSLPTWRDPWGWAIFAAIGVLILVRGGGLKLKLPELPHIPRRPRKPKSKAKPVGGREKKQGKAEEFGFDPERFKAGD